MDDRHDVNDLAKQRTWRDHGSHLAAPWPDLARAPVGVALLTGDGAIRQTNESLERIVGRPAEELTGRRFAVLVHPDDVDDWNHLLGCLRDDRDASHLTVRYVDRRGQVVWADTLAWRCRGGNGGPAEVVVLVHDATDMHRAEARRQSQAALARLGEMAAVVAHEIRNPLAGIGGTLKLIARGFSPETPEHTALEESHRRLHSLETVVENLLRFARPVEPGFQPVPVTAVLDDAASFLHGEMGYRDVNVERAGEDCTVRADPQLLAVLFHNLYLNAAQAMHGGGPIRATTSRQGERCIVLVADSGPGIQPALREKVFDPFFTTKVNGAGLGLPIARRIADAHRGAIGVRCPSRGGAVLEVKLPLWDG